MRSLPHLVRAMSGPLAIERRTLDGLIAVFRRKFAGASFTGPDLHAELGIEDTEPVKRDTGVIKVIPIRGVIAHHPQSMGWSVDEIEREFTRALADSQVSAILFDISSPGGEVTGVPELADRIRAARGTKPMMALANGLMASAAYWIGAAADEIAIIPSGEAGSIGVWSLHEDWTKWLENEGIVISEFSAGEFKTEGAPWKALTPEARAFYEERVQEVYDWFVRSVAKSRDVKAAAVRAGYGRGRVLGAEQAMAEKLVDKVLTFDDAVTRLAGRIKRAQKRRGPSADVLRRRLALDSTDG